MNCQVCNNRRGQRECIKLDKLICSRCCGSTRNWCECPLSCRYLPTKSEPQTEIYTKGMMAYSSKPGGKNLRFCDYLFLPNIYSCMTFNLINFEMSFKDIQTLNLHIDFIIENNSINDLSDSLPKDSWKKHYYPLGIEESNLNPLIGISTPNGLFSLRKEDLKLNPSSKFRSSTTHWTISSPFQRSIIFPNGNYTDVKFLFARNLMIFDELKFNTPYELDINMYNVNKLQDNKSLETRIGLIIPFGRTIFGQYSIWESPGTHIEHALGTYTPKSSDFYPGEKRGELTFLPLNGHENTIFGNLIDKPMNQGEIIKECPSFCAWRMISTPQMDVLVSVLSHDNVINPRLLNPLLDWVGDIACPIHVKIINTSSQTKRFLIRATEQNTNKIWEDSVTVRSNVENTVPLRLEGIRNNDPGDSSIKIEVIENSLVWHTEIVRLHILPKDNLLLRIHDMANDWYLDTSYAVACWITPTDPAIDKWISNARSKSSSGMFLGSLGDPLPQIEALWNELEEMGVSYVTRSYCCDFERSAYQRVTIPNNTLELCSGNCIDLTVLFASALEQLGLEPLIVFISDPDDGGHAFLGWENGDESLGFLETTWINQKGFKYALKDGKNEYEENKGFFGQKMGYNILKVSDLREIGLRPIFP